MAILERFVVLLYSESCPATRTNQARKALFSKAKKALDPIPPTQAALFEHSQNLYYRHFSIHIHMGGCASTTTNNSIIHRLGLGDD